MKSKNCRSINLIAVAILCVSGMAGCDVLFPGLSSSVVTPADDPDSTIADPHEIRVKMQEACKDVPKEDLLKLYGILAATADYVVLNVDDDKTNHDVLNLMKKASVLTGWDNTKYPKITTVVKTAYASYVIPETESDSKEYTLEDRLPLNRCRSQLNDALRLLASGCRLATE